jgi:hypothetical protein
MKKVRRSRRNRRDSRGSALLVSLMVIVGLSLLGLGFVAISETESAIAKNEENALQTQSIAEAGARMVVEWFQDPLWAETNAALPANTGAITSGVIPAAGAIKTQRTVQTGTDTYVGVYKPQTSQHLCDKPYRPDQMHRFYGDEDHADIIINRATNADAVDAFNDKLLASDGTNATALDKLAGEVTEIKIYAPPIVNGVLTNGFWVGGERYGVATIKVTAQQFQKPPTAGANNGTNVIASHSVRLVVGELPLPIPAGPIQGDANVSFGGNFRVHWGMETSRYNLTPSLNLSSLPWANAYERPHFERGYEQGTGIDAVVVTSGGSGYTSAPAVTFNGGGGANAAATAHVTPSGIVDYVTINNAGSGYNTDPANAPTVTFTGGAGTGAAAVASVGREVWPVVPGSQFDQNDFFHELLGKDFQDPWYGARAYQDNLTDGTNSYNFHPQLYPYVYNADEQSNSTAPYHFQWQDANSFPDKKKVTFPVIKYDFWKKITQAAKGYTGIYYFKYTGAHAFQKWGQGVSKSIQYWVNTVGGAKLSPGIYFFDTKTGQNPQGLSAATRATILTEDESWQSNDFGTPGMLMSGFVYLNTKTFGTTGQGNNATTIQANFPGEPFRDVGYPVWCLAVGNPIAQCTAGGKWADCGGSICRSGVGDSKFSCQDLQTGKPHEDGKCRIVVMQAPAWHSYDPNLVAHAGGVNLPQCGSGCVNTHPTYVVKTWKSNEQATRDYGAPCQAPPANWDGTSTAPGNICSEPHEPYLNLIFPDKAANNNGDPYNVVVGWEAPNQQTTRPKTVDNQGNVVACNPPDADKCISNGYDIDGAVVPLDVILYGILYDEGQWGSEGNAWFYGSVLVQDDINLSSGTADVWFDEKLLKGTWAPPKMPRVIVFSEQTDEQQQ